MAAPRRGVATDHMIAQNVTNALNSRGISRLAFAKALGVAPSTVTAKLAGNVTWSAYDLECTSRMLNLPIGSFFSSAQ